MLRVYVGITGALVLLSAATTSMSGFTRLAHSLGEHGQLPRAFGRLNRRTLVSPQAILAVAAISIALVIGSAIADDDVVFLASLYSFGVLLAFAAAQIAVVRLRVQEHRPPAPVPGADDRAVRRRAGGDLRLGDRDGDAPRCALRRAGVAPRRPRPVRSRAQARPSELPRGSGSLHWNFRPAPTSTACSCR